MDLVPRVAIVQTTSVANSPSKIISLLNPTTMKKLLALSIALTVAGLSGASAQVIYKTIDQTEMNLSWVYVSGSPGFNPSIPNLVADFTSLNSVTMSPTDRATNTAWYNPVGGGEGSVGTKTLTSWLYGTSVNLNQQGSSIEFSGNVTDLNLGTNISGIPYTLEAKIMDFTVFADIVQTILPLTNTGTFTLRHELIGGTNRQVRWGLQLVGPNIWPTDEAQFATAGSVTVVPEPSTYALLGLAAVVGLVVFRSRRQA